MTGAEIIIIQGCVAVLGKVRSDGHQVEEYLEEHVPTFQGTPKELWKEIMQARLVEWGQEQFDEYEIKSAYALEGFMFELPPDTPKEFEAISELAKNNLVATIPGGMDNEDGYLCGYNDIVYLIDLDNDGTNRMKDYD